MKFSAVWDEIQLERNISFFQPGIIFIAGLLILHAFSPRNNTNIGQIVKVTAMRLPTTFASITCLAIMSRLLTQDLNIGEYLGNEAMPAPVLNIVAVGTGFIGSFMAGSSTVSNLLFGEQLYAVGQQYGFNTSLLSASQLAGSAIGNALSIQNIAMVQAVVNEKGLESIIFKKLWKPVLLFFLLIGLTAFVLALAPEL